MKFQLVTQTQRVGMQLEAIPDQILDGQPKVDRLMFDAILESVSPDHIAVSSAIAFGDFVAHDLSFASPISRQAAEAIQEYLATRRVSVGELTDAPRKQWPTEGRLEILPSSKSIKLESFSFNGDSAHRLYLVDGAAFSGALGSPLQSIVASNYRVFSRANSVHPTKVLVTHGVLFSRDLHVRLLAAPLDGLDEHDAQRIADLVRAVDLNIRFY